MKQKEFIKKVTYGTFELTVIVAILVNLILAIIVLPLSAFVFKDLMLFIILYSVMTLVFFVVFLADLISGRKVTWVQKK